MLNKYLFTVSFSNEPKKPHAQTLIHTEFIAKQSFKSN